MINKKEQINKLLAQKKIIQEQIESANFKGYPEIKEINGKKYIYLRYKKYDRLSSEYAGIYNPEFYKALKEMSLNIKKLKTDLRIVKTKLAYLGYEDKNLSASIIKTMEYLRINLKSIIYEQAIVEGVSATFFDTEEILEHGQTKNVSFDDTLKILNLKNAWTYALDEDVLKLKISFNILTTIAGFINDRLVSYPDSIRQTNVRIGGSTYKPPIPQKDKVENDIKKILTQKKKSIDIAIDLFIYICKAQIFNDGNKRTALIFSNFYLLKQSYGYISIPVDKEKELKQLLVDYYEDKNRKIINFLKKNCTFPMD